MVQGPQKEFLSQTHSSHIFGDMCSYKGKDMTLSSTTIFDSPIEFTRLYVHAIFLVMFGSLLERIVEKGFHLSVESLQLD